jgi:hypothetical protein
MRTLTLALLLLAAGCGSREAGADTAVSDSAGVRIVQSDADNPVWGQAETWMLSANPRLQVGNRAGNPNQQLYQVRDAERLPDGRILVANFGIGMVRIFDGAGSHVANLSTPAPDGETVAPVGVYALPGDSVLAVGSDGSLSVYASDGRLARRASVTLPADGVEGSFRPVGRFDDGSLLYRVDLPDDSLATGTGRRMIRLLRYGADGRLIAPYGDFEDQALLFADRGGWIFGPSAQHAIADSTIWYGTAERFELREITADGRTRQVFRLVKAAAPVLSTDRVAYEAAAKRQVEGTSLAPRMDTTLQASVYADSFPAFDRILVDDEGNVWARNYQWFDIGSGYAWTVFDPTGRYLGVVRVPSLLEIFQIGSDFVLGRMADPRGREAVYVYALIKPGVEGGEGEPPGP